LKPLRLRQWQSVAIDRWREEGHRGIASVVTGGGKTYFALACLHEYRQRVPAATAVIVVPTSALQDQWLAEIIEVFDLPLSHLNILTRRSKVKRSLINVGVINSVADVAARATDFKVFLIVDECHRAASDQFQGIFRFSTDASLGLSATPERPYDDGFEKVLLPNLGPIISRYTYRDALRDKVIVPFQLRNVVFDLEPAEQEKYTKLTKAIRLSIEKHGLEADESVRLMLARSRLVNGSIRRVEIAAKLVARNLGRKIIVFHEDIRACELLCEILTQHRVAHSLYHSRVPMKERVESIQRFRHGGTSVMVACRALDEGFNVPESDMAIIAASTATHRQRVQRLGRVLRPASGKGEAIIWSIVASEPEIRRLAAEADDLEGVADVKWSRA
jgi:superfamily II DNA or RNA helicase